jgi:hypothetical protein
MGLAWYWVSACNEGSRAKRDCFQPVPGSFSWVVELITEGSWASINGTLLPWVDTLLEALHETCYPLRKGLSVLPETIVPPPRCSMLPALPTSSPNEKSAPLSSESWVPANTFPTTIKQLDRITREGWYQDVRHIEFECEDPISSVLFLFFLYERTAEKGVMFVDINRAT